MSDNEFGSVDLTGIKPDKLPRLIDMPVVKELVDTLRTLVDAIDWVGGKDSFSTERAHRILKALEAKDD